MDLYIWRVNRIQHGMFYVQIDNMRAWVTEVIQMTRERERERERERDGNFSFPSVLKGKINSWSLPSHLNTHIVFRFPSSLSLSLPFILFLLLILSLSSPHSSYNHLLFHSYISSFSFSSSFSSPKGQTQQPNAFQIPHVSQARHISSVGKGSEAGVPSSRSVSFLRPPAITYLRKTTPLPTVLSQRLS